MILLLAATAALSVSAAQIQNLSCDPQRERTLDALGFQRFSVSTKCSVRQLDRAQDTIRNRNPRFQVLGIEQPESDRYTFIVAPKDVVEGFTDQHFTPCGSYRTVSWDRSKRPYLITYSAAAQSAVCEP